MLCMMGHPILRLGGLLGEPVAEDGEGKPEADHGVGDDDAGEDEDTEAGEGEETSVKAGSCAREGPPGEGFDDECEGEDGEGEGDSCGGGTDAEELETGSHGPVKERGFFEVPNVVGVESDPVVAKKHLAGDLGVDGVGVVEERRSDESEACVAEEPESNQDDAVALDRGIGGRGHVISV